MINVNRTVLRAGLAVMLAATPCLMAQGTRADYERANSLRQRTENKVFKQSVKPQWLAGNSRCWYRNELADNRREFILVDAEKGTRQPAFDHARLAAALSKAIGREVSADRLPIDKLEFGEGDSSLFFSSGGMWWQCELQSYELRQTNRNERTTSSLRPISGYFWSM